MEGAGFCLLYQEFCYIQVWVFLNILFDELCHWLSFLQTIFVGLGVKNQLIFVKTIDFSLLVPQKLSIESSINDEVHQKSTFSTSYYLPIPSAFVRRKYMICEKIAHERIFLSSQYYLHWLGYFELDSYLAFSISVIVFWSCSPATADEMTLTIFFQVSSSLKKRSTKNAFDVL